MKKIWMLNAVLAMAFLLAFGLSNINLVYADQVHFPNKYYIPPSSEAAVCVGTLTVTDENPYIAIDVHFAAGMDSVNIRIHDTTYETDYSHDDYQMYFGFMRTLVFTDTSKVIPGHTYEVWMSANGSGGDLSVFPTIVNFDRNIIAGSKVDFTGTSVIRDLILSGEKSFLAASVGELPENTTVDIMLQNDVLGEGHNVAQNGLSQNKTVIFCAWAVNRLIVNSESYTVMFSGNGIGEEAQIGAYAINWTFGY